MSLTPCAADPIVLNWVKSSHSSNDGPECVEAAAALSAVHVRDSKNPRGPQLAFSPAAWTGFLTYAAYARTP